MTAGGRRRRRACALGLLLAVAAVAVTALLEARSSASGDTAGSPDLRESVVFFYQRIDPVSDAAKFAGASAVVTSPQPDEQGAAAAIHAAGARAFMYVNVYWLPWSQVYDGIELSQHPGWAFCMRGHQPLLGRTVAGDPWYYLDLNEQRARAAVMSYLASLKAAGFDGVFFDRGSPALRGRPPSGLAWVRSTCTQRPIMAGRPRSANVFVNLLREVKQRLGLSIYMNYGHPFSSIRLRPDPDDPGCRGVSPTPCRYLRDVWRWVDRVIDENANPPTLAGFAADYRENMASQRGGSRPGRPARVIREIKVQSVDPVLVFYLWARARLFRLATFVNTGDDRCVSAAPDQRHKCQRFGTFPQLTQIHLGAALGPRPGRHACVSAAPGACVWTRRYASGLVALNTRRRPERLEIGLGVGACRRITVVSAGGAAPLGGGECISRIVYRLPAKRGVVFVYQP